MQRVQPDGIGASVDTGNPLHHDYVHSVGNVTDSHYDAR
jgi:hypothetical protein